MDPMSDVNVMAGLEGDPTAMRPKKTYAEFFIEPVKQEFKSTQAGRPIYEDELRVRILIPGDPRSIPVHVATDYHKRIYRDEYEAFLKNEDQISVSGTPLKEWAAMTRSLAMSYAAVNIATIEQLAEIDDQQLSQLGPGARDYRQKAIDHLEQSKDTAHAMKLGAELEQSKQDNAMLQEQIRELAKQIETLQTQVGAGK